MRSQVISRRAFFIFRLSKRFKMFCQNCGEHYNFQEPRCPWCGAPKPVVAVKKNPVKEEPEPKPSTPISKRCVAALVLFVVCIASLSTLASIAFINELLNIPDFDTMYIIAPLYLLGIPLLGVHGYMYDKGQKLSPQNDSKNDIFSMFRTMNDFFYAAPFKYAYHCIKERNYKGLILFAIDISIISFIIAL